MLALYRWLLLLYPGNYRAEFGEEMQTVFSEAEHDFAGLGMFALAAFYFGEFTGMVQGAIEEHICSWTGGRPWAVMPRRRYTMRSEFRFSKATPVLMTLILIGIVIAIEKATAIRNSAYPDVSAHVGPIQPEHFTFLPTILLCIACAYLAGMIGWAVLFALRRSGMHRLNAMNARQE